MWQGLIAMVIVALAAAWLGRRLYRSLRGREAACCGGEADPDQGCLGCVKAPPQSLEELTAPQACLHCGPGALPGPASIGGHGNTK